MKVKRSLACVFVLSALLACDMEPLATPAEIPLEVAMAKGGKKGGNPGDGESEPTGNAATFAVQELDLHTDDAGFPYGDGSVQCDAEARVLLAGTSPTEARLALPAPPRKADQEDPSCRQLLLRLDTRHDGFDANGAHIDTTVEPEILRIKDLVIHVNNGNAPIGTAEISTTDGFCAGARKRGRTVAPASFRFNPSGSGSIGGSTVLNVDAQVPASKWRVTSDAETVAGCAQSSSVTTFWHIDLDFDVESIETAPPPPPPPPPSGATIAVESGTSLQRLVGWEATAQAGQFELNEFPEFQNAVLDRTIDELGINRVRLEVRSGAENNQDYFEMWRTGAISRAQYREQWYNPVNDNADPNATNASGFKFGRLDASVDLIVTPMRQRSAANGESLYINLCFVDFHGTPGITALDPNEYAEFMLVTFQHLQSKYGWVPDAIEIILEPDLTTWNGVRIGQAIVATAERLAEAGFNPDFVAPSTTSMAAAVEYFDDMAQVSGAIAELSEISYHRYAGVSQGALQAIANRAQANGLGTAMLEHIGSGYENLHEDLKLGMNTSWSQFTIAWDDSADDGGKYYLVDNANQTRLGQRTKLLRQYMFYLRADAQRVAASSTDGALDPLAFINPSGKFVVVVKADGANEFTIDGIPAGTYGVNYSTLNNNNVELASVTIASGGSLAAEIPGKGVVTIYQK